MRTVYAYLLSTLIFTTFLGSCNAAGKGNDADGADSSLADDFHADNDIAMMIRSVADAIRIGEALDSADYNFHGILTDGQGVPLYTNVQGMPGIWDVEVMSPTSIAIRNRDVGDLLPEDLELYLANALDISESDILSDEQSVLDNDNEASRTVYDFDGGYLRIDTRAAMAANGLEGPLMTITASRRKPAL